MKRILIAAVALAAIGGAAAAQPAYDASQGAAPADYQPCKHAGQDRCIARAHFRGDRHHHHHHHAKGKDDKDAKAGGAG